MNFRNFGLSIAVVSSAAFGQVAEKTRELKLKTLNTVLTELLQGSVADLADIGFTKDSTIKILPDSTFDEVDLGAKKIPNKITLNMEEHFFYKPLNGLTGNVKINNLFEAVDKEYLNFTGGFKVSFPSSLLAVRHLGKLLSEDNPGRTPGDLKRAEIGKKFVQAKRLKDFYENLILWIDVEIADARKEENPEKSVKGLNFRQILTLVKENLKLSSDGEAVTLELKDFNVSDPAFPESLSVTSLIAKVNSQSIDVKIKFSFKGPKDTSLVYNNLVTTSEDFHRLSRGDITDKQYRMTLSYVKNLLTTSAGLVGIGFNRN